MLFTASLLLLLPWASAAPANLPIVDLGYQRHQAISFNSTGQYYSFTNIRYAEPPLGSRRFAPPVAPHGRSKNIVNGTGLGYKCPQALACWFNVQNKFTSAAAAGTPFDFNAAYEEVYTKDACTEPAKQDPLQSEDCLFLDVYVPQDVWQKGPQAAHQKGGAPVLVYLQDGAYVGGSKSDQNPAGLIARSREEGSSGMIYVGINYRLGVFGWLSGRKFTSSGGKPNAGLLDQRLALEWIQRHIHLFGGDPSRVTVMGVSAGGGSIIMQMTAYGRGISPPFAQVITQSPAWEPGTKTPAIEDDLFDTFLASLNVTSLDQARRLPSHALTDANYRLVASRPYGAGVLGPAIDGDFIPDSPKRLLLQGKANPGVRVLTSYTAAEGFGIAPANITDEASFQRYVGLMLAGTDASVRTHAATVLYPAVFDGSMPYRTQHDRASLLWADLAASCNTRYLHAAVRTPGYAIEYSVPPALHLSDTPSVFYNGPVADPTVNGTIAELLQRQIVRFVKTGNPNGEPDPEVPVYDGRDLLDLGDDGVLVRPDSTDNARCEYWQKVHF
ncbi:carboxylesterase family protein [Aspergillus clavatus NRRL 1]|uniref:Carboxylesterase patB n=1 Tax=Aspergillus clavatus (strain ATCC 1007 / CBS 513.65 / DSM 816 / NCTC 3887 / NRRL 1 / QM 1276 / 107) TaxID=344612 RepID=PATB_ASPCL|nr:carboxylesterase family protein [Aspergillus clavatus NRRL 1]A1CFK9.1 RecName: Full=Carboxylesterase patB; AltName: Full=Patulin synthesis protein B; Flags: Precursor [Aspergillus clavatus NRRL 1]EAW11658.1 carboxylesterase family protein [Aspergillus clavatus NRRL 1]